MITLIDSFCYCCCLPLLPEVACSIHFFFKNFAGTWWRCGRSRRAAPSSASVPWPPAPPSTPPPTTSASSASDTSADQPCEDITLELCRIHATSPNKTSLTGADGASGRCAARSAAGRRGTRPSAMCSPPAPGRARMRCAASKHIIISFYCF